MSNYLNSIFDKEMTVKPASQYHFHGIHDNIDRNIVFQSKKYFKKMLVNRSTILNKLSESQLPIGYHKATRYIINQ